jgi:hypothetical protein
MKGTNYLIVRKNKNSPARKLHPFVLNKKWNHFEQQLV